MDYLEKVENMTEIENVESLLLHIASRLDYNKFPVEQCMTLLSQYGYQSMSGTLNINTVQHRLDTFNMPMLLFSQKGVLLIRDAKDVSKLLLTLCTFVQPIRLNRGHFK
jgi:hypothetical protein